MGEDGRGGVGGVGKEIGGISLEARSKKMIERRKDAEADANDREKGGGLGAELIGSIGKTVS